MLTIDMSGICLSYKLTYEPSAQVSLNFDFGFYHHQNKKKTCFSVKVHRSFFHTYLNLYHNLVFTNIPVYLREPQVLRQAKSAGVCGTLSDPIPLYRFIKFSTKVRNSVSPVISYIRSCQNIAWLKQFFTSADSEEVKS